MPSKEIERFAKYALKDYCELILDRRSLLVKVMGIYKIHYTKQSVMIMVNVIKKNKALIYDMKGSMYNRYSTGKVLKD